MFRVLGKFLSTRILSTVMLLSFWTDRSGQTVQTQIRLLLEEQSDQGLHCLQFPLHLSDALLRKRHLVQLLGYYHKFSGVQNFRIFMVSSFQIISLPAESKLNCKCNANKSNQFDVWLSWAVMVTLCTYPCCQLYHIIISRGQCYIII